MMCLKLVKLLITKTNLGSQSEISMTDSVVDIGMQGPDHPSRKTHRPSDLHTALRSQYLQRPVSCRELPASGAPSSWSSPHLATEQHGAKRPSRFDP